MRALMITFNALLLVAGLLTGCVTSAGQLREVSLGMTKKEVVNSLGEPTAARGAITNKYSQAVEVWEYTLALPSTDSPGQIIGKSVLTVITFGLGAAKFKGERKNYWLYFVDDRLVQWGEAGDWSKEPDRIYEFKFNPSPSLRK